MNYTTLTQCKCVRAKLSLLLVFAKLLCYRCDQHTYRKYMYIHTHSHSYKNTHTYTKVGQS